MKSLFIIAIVSLLCACASNPLQIENRIACTVAKDKAYIIGTNGLLGGSLAVNKDDAAILCGVAK